MALGDMDADGFTDLITVDMTQNSFTVHFFDSDEKLYKKSDPVKIDSSQNSKI